jgi:hypothetical protein
MSDDTNAKIAGELRSLRTVLRGSNTLYAAAVGGIVMAGTRP